MKTIEIKPPYLIFLGSESRQTYAKTGIGLVQWRPELCAGQLGLSDDTIDLGLPALSLQQAADAGIKSLIIGTAFVGGKIPPEWTETLIDAASIGLDIVAGVHQRLNSIPKLRAAAKISGAQLIDVRVPPAELPVASGKKRTGKRLLMVGTDCAVGKKYTALALAKEMKAAGMNAHFRASGQTGIMIAGKGIPIDAVISDFLSGAAELLSPANSDNHWDIIEGQGSIFHPGYSSVSLGLLIGSQPDMFIVCHEAGRKRISGWEGFVLPSIEDVIDRTITLGKQTNPDIKCIGVSVNTSKLPSSQRKDYLSQLSNKLKLPCFDPLIDGTLAVICSIKNSQ